MLIGRFAMIVPMLALGRLPLGAEDRAAEPAGTFPVTTPLFVVLLIGVILIVGALTFFPALSLGPDRRALLMQVQGKSCFVTWPPVASDRPLFHPPIVRRGAVRSGRTSSTRGTCSGTR